jgi:hypothetical protein
MYILNERIRIEVSEPFEWNYGTLYGDIKEVISDEELLIQLDEPIKGRTFTSDLLKVTTRCHGDTFQMFTHDTPITVNGALTHSANKTDFIFVGTLFLRQFKSSKILTGTWLYDNIKEMPVSIWKLNYDCGYEIDVADALMEKGQKPEILDGGEWYMVRFDDMDNWSYSGAEPFGGRTLEEAKAAAEEKLPSKVTWKE